MEKNLAYIKTYLYRWNSIIQKMLYNTLVPGWFDKVQWYMIVYKKNLKIFCKEKQIKA